MPRLILHIGDQQTGTSSIQQALASGAGGPGVLYPQAGRRMGAGHHNLAWEISGDTRFDPEHGDWAAVAAEIACSDAPLVAVSSAAFEFISPDAVLTHIRNRLKGAVEEICVIAYLRPHASRLMASFAERVRRGVGPYEARGFLEDALSSGRFVYADRLTAWRRAAGREHLILRPFRRDKLVAGDVTADFFATALDRPPPTAKERASIGPSAPMLRLMQIYHAALAARGGADLALTQAEPVARLAADAFGEAEERAHWSAVQMRQIANAFRDDAHAVDALLGGGFFVDTLDAALARAKAAGAPRPPLAAETEIALRAAAAAYAEAAMRQGSLNSSSNSTAA